MEERPAGRILLETVRKGDTLIVAKLDRAFRNAEDALRKARELSEAGIDLIVADMGHEPVTGNGVAKMFFGMLALMAEFERDRLLERTRDGKAAKRAAGGHVGGQPPFGYRVQGTGKDSTLVPVPAEQIAIGRIIRLREGGMSYRNIAAEIREALRVRISHEGVRKVVGAVNENPSYYQPPEDAK